ncbi:MAG TPA: peptidoglycan-binding domain-containing protein [Anaeromyxobacteraceae bacterium]|nr:peptidoglycan-binding domain-containing protein [Anaeromyxobacteraceae bacterium]
MSVMRFLGVGLVAAIGSAPWMARAGEPASFIGRVEQTHGIMQGREEATGTAVSEVTPSEYGQPASFIARVEQSQGIVQTEENESPTVTTTGPYGPTASFIARVEESQHVMPTRLLESEDQLSPEQIRLVQRALADKGYSTQTTGRLDEATRSSLMSFQHAQALPVSGTLDSKTVESLGFDVNQVTPVRGPNESR